MSEAAGKIAYEHWLAKMRVAGNEEMMPAHLRPPSWEAVQPVIKEMFTLGAEGVLAEAAKHVPTIKMDKTEAWVVCSCGMQSFGTGKTWAEWWKDHILELKKGEL